MVRSVATEHSWRKQALAWAKPVGALSAIEEHDWFGWTGGTVGSGIHSCCWRTVLSSLLSYHRDLVLCGHHDFRTWGDHCYLTVGMVRLLGFNHVGDTASSGRRDPDLDWWHQRHSAGSDSMHRCIHLGWRRMQAGTTTDFSDDMIACLAGPFGSCWDFRRTGFSFTTSY